MIIPVIMCGGAGTRLWPASRESMPKQFLSLFSERSTFQETMLRVMKPDLFARPIVITSADFRFVVAEQLLEAGVQADIILEPMRRDSAAAVAVATVLGQSREKNAILLILAADHAIKHVNRFHDACLQALPVAEQGKIVTFGVVPDEPSTGYGYLRPGAVLNGGPVRVLEAFAEKPDSTRAQSYMDQGFLWNSGNFLFRADVMRAELERFQPEIMAAVEGAVTHASVDLDFVRLSEAEFATAPKISIDYAVMEKTDSSAVLPVDIGWSDLGGWDAIWAHAAHDENGNALSGACEVLDVKNSLVSSESTILTTVIGLENVAVVVTADAVLVAPRTVGAQIKTLLQHMQDKGRPEATEHRRVYRPWGYYEGMNVGERHLVKRIVVNPGHQLSLQKHYHRSEHWVVVRGTGEITIEGAMQTLHENQSTYIPVNAIHRLKNPGRIPLELIEIQVGSYLGENDIVRIEDAYNRIPK